MPPTQQSCFAVAEIRRLTGKAYPKLEATFETLDPEALRDLVRLTHDLNHAVHSAGRKGAREPWRHT
jgi:hypothetical protein